MDEDGLKQLKADLRQQVLARRDAMGLDERRDANENAVVWALSVLGILCRSAIDTGGVSGQSRRKPISAHITTIGLFWPIRSEIDCRPLAKALRQEGLSVALPFCLSKTEMEFRLWQEEADLVPAGFGTRAPDETAEVVLPDIILVPLAGFDVSGNRLGYGAGYYDRYMGRLDAEGRSVYRAGFAYACQQLDNVPAGLYDQKLNIVITDQGLI